MVEFGTVLNYGTWRRKELWGGFKVILREGGRKGKPQREDQFLWGE